MGPLNIRCCRCSVTSVVSDSVRPHRRQPTRLLGPWDSPDKNTEWVAISFSNAWKWKWSRSVVADSSQPHGLQPTRLLRPWDSTGKSSGVGCRGLLQTFIECLLYATFHVRWFPCLQTSRNLILRNAVVLYTFSEIWNFWLLVNLFAGQPWRWTQWENERARWIERVH